MTTAVSLAESASRSGDGSSSGAEQRVEWLTSRNLPTSIPKASITLPPKINFRTSEIVGTRLESQTAATDPTASSGQAKESEAEKAKPLATPKRAQAGAKTESGPAKAKAIASPSPKIAAAIAAAEFAPVTKANPAEVKTGESSDATLPPPIAEGPSRRKFSVNSTTRAAIAGPMFGESRYAWKMGIVTTVFWVGEPAGGRNSTPNHASSWDAKWKTSFGGFDNPDPAARRNFIPIKFTPRQNPFYVALPYNDVTRGTTKPEARRMIPWFKEAFQKEGQSVCRDRWVAIRNREGKIGYAQWSDCGPFRTDHWQYVFGNERPKPNLNKGAGLDVSPALRDYLGLSSTDVTDWKFVDVREIPNGPWAVHGENNTMLTKNSRNAKNTSRESGRTAGNTARRSGRTAANTVSIRGREVVSR
jgi:hypothetical protein